MAFLASVSLWLGWYNLVDADLCFTQLVRKLSIGHFKVGRLLRYRFQLGIALLLLWATSTFFAVSGVSVEEQDEREKNAAEEVHSKSSVWTQLRAFCRANVSIFAQTLWFSGAYGFLELEC